MHYVNKYIYAIYMYMYITFSPLTWCKSPVAEFQVRLPLTKPYIAGANSFSESGYTSVGGMVR